MQKFTEAQQAARGDAVGTLRSVLPLLSQQAAAIEQYIMSIRHPGEDASEILNQLQAYEDQIRQGKAADDSDITLNNFLANMETVGEGIRELLRTNMDNGSWANFSTQFDAHQKLNYLITRDWKTAADGELEAKRTEYIDARLLTGMYIGGSQGTYTGGGRSGISIAEIGVNPSADVGTYCRSMRELVLDVLGLFVSDLEQPQTDSLNAFVDALITQMGDCEELRAFKDDVEAKREVDNEYIVADWVSPDLNNGMAPLPEATPVPEVAQAAETQSTRLAHVDKGTMFSRNLLAKGDVIKGAGGREYTGAYTPLYAGKREEGHGLV
jgi:hypothetical protein